jgi:hypothetical protein
MSPRVKSVEERFWTKVDRRDDCWLWTGALTAGYGIIRINGSGADTRRGYAHRVAWELVHGPIPSDMRVVHRCRTARCVNPAHLVLVSEDTQLAEMWQARDHRLQTDPTYNRGARNPSARLTDEDVREMRQRHTAGASGRQLASAYGMSTSQVGRILRRESWRHI